ncbi:hypothetical protein [Nocardioides sediminis]|uniref:hypothetical protein n=1 Tax=Nocardioides sediminis TaxID=433648 RepID=UPI00131F18AF|nr:hypothetical protein [Nocardioides sediminis]
MAQHRHKRDANARRTPRRTPSAVQVAGPVAALATLSAVAVGVLTANPSVPGTDDLLASSSNAAAGISASGVAQRDEVVSRSERREAREDARQEARKEARQQAREQARKEARREAKATQRAVRAADTRLWTTTELNLWTSAGGDARNVGLVDDLEKVLVTGRKDGDRVEVVVNGKSRWVTAGYLANKKPKPPAPAGPSLGGQCSNGSSIDAGSPSLYEIHDAVCANWPEITSYGTWRNDGEHGEGRAIDVMVSGSTGWEIAEFLRANYSALGIEYIIYSQKIWSVDRAGEGWRYMSDRGSTTANHYDHVHVTVY